MTDETPRADARTPELSVSKTTRDGAVALWVALDEAGIEARLQPFNGRWRVFYPASAHRRVSECSQQVRAARTPEPAGEQEPTDVRELRERLRVLPETRRVEEQTRDDVVLTRAEFARLVTERGEAAVALVRLEALDAALERICRNDIGASFDQRYVEERVRDFVSWERGFSDALSIVQRIAGRALATPAPAPQQGGEE